MKATELMIGDWAIHDYYKTPIQIKAIPNAEQIYHPIPLTSEILEKNGFKWCNNLQKMMFYPNIKSPFIVQIKEGVVWYEAFGGDRVLNYVHTLQHALRLCGLDKLADNFKI